MNGLKEEPKFDVSKIKEVEELLVLKQHRARPFGSNETKLFFPGEKYKQNGLDKLQVLGTGHCTTNLNAVVPPNTKRKAPIPGQASEYSSPTDLLCSKIDLLVNTVNELVLKKK